MTTAYSTLLGLALPVQGELSGVWGDTIDNGITRYLDIAVAGTVTLTNDGAVTLSLTNGDSSATNIVSSLTGAGTTSAQFAIIRVTGTLTVAKVLTAPSSSRTYVVVNAATGSTVTVKASGQTGVSIAVGETAFVYFNGTDYVKIVGTSTAGAAGGSTTQVQYNNAGVLAGITGATTNGTALTLVAPVLGTPASGTVTNLTGTASININGTVGATTATTGAFTTLTTSSTVTLNGGTANGVAYLNASKVLTTGTALTFDGTTLTAPRYQSTSSNAALPSYGVEAGSGIFNAGASTIGFSAGSAEQMRLTTTGLGIGTSSPSYKLDVFRGATNGAVAQFTGNNSGRGLKVSTAQTSFADDTVVLDAQMATYGTLQLATGGTTRATIDGAGNLGLGVAPSAWSTASQNALQILSAGVSGNNGGNTASRFTHACYLDGSTWKYQYTSVGPARYEITGPNSGSAHSWSIAAGGTAGNTISFTQAMTLDASGNLSVGTTTARVRLEVAGNIEIANTAVDGVADALIGGLQATPRTSVANATFASANIQFRNDPTLYYKGVITFGTSGDFTSAAPTERMRIDSTGIVTMSAYGAGAATFSAAGVISSVSDETWKIKDGVPVDTDAMLKKLEPGYWYYNDEKKETFGTDRQLGFYAQNVNAAIGPEAAPTPEEGKPWGYYDRSVLAITVMSLQKALATIETLTARITALESK